jgi:beta-lactamase regulating signal transducer with metallopeptidase domain
MNPLLQSLASEQWAFLVKALLHTLWLGGLAAGGLYLVLRGKTDPVSRCRWCAGALFAVVFCGIVAWAFLERRPAGGLPSDAATSSAIAAPMHGAPVSVTLAPPPANVASSLRLDRATPGQPAGPRPGSVASSLRLDRATPGQPATSLAGQWTPWLALVWLGGVAAMLARAGSLVVGAEKLRRKSRPLENEAVLKLIQEARRKLGLMRRIQVVVTEQLTSPAVMGIVTPVLILPLSMVTTLPIGQLQLILLHELAHIQRGDYLVNLCQLLAESLLFFNPAVWWISRQIRQEREACCDAVAIALAGERFQYAQALANAAGEALAAAPAFGDRRNPSGLKDRIQRLLVPGYRPAPRLTWCALLAALFVGGGLLLLSALGTRVAVKAILSPQERIARIEKKMAELGETPELPNFNGDWENRPKITVSGKLRMADGTPVPKWVSMNLVSVAHRSSFGSGEMARDGYFSNIIPAGTIFIAGEVTNCAPAQIGPLDGLATNRLENLELVFSPGFNALINLTDVISGKPVAGAALRARFWLRGHAGSNFRERTLTTDENGSALLTHAADLPLVVSVNVPGYEILEQRFESVQPGKPLRAALRPGAKVSGVALDKTSGQPIAGATVRVVFEKGPAAQGYGWDDPLRVLATTDQNGRFEANQLRTDTVYWLGVSAPGHESVVLNNVSSVSNPLEARLGPELIVRCRVTGDLDQLDAAWNGNDEKQIAYSILDITGENNTSFGNQAPVRIVDGVGYFQFTNPVAGRVVINAPGHTSFERTVDAPVDDWLIDLTQAQKTDAKNAPKREVIFRFKDPSGGIPHGMVQVQIPDNLDKNRQTAHYADLEITNGEVHADIAIGGRTAIGSGRMVGYWLDRVGEHGHLLSIEVTNGPGPMVVEFPLLPAGAIYATARNADGTPAGGLYFGLIELKRAPGKNPTVPLDDGSDEFNDSAPRKWISGPLPLGGTYQIYGWRGNLFCVGKPVKLTDASPDAEVELQFPPGKAFNGVVLDQDGKPLANCELKVSFELADGHDFGLKSVFTDAAGRFRLEDMTPEFGKYSVQADAPGFLAESVRLDFGSQPQTIRLKRGRTLAGRVVEAGTGYAIPDAEVRALDYDSGKLPMVTTRTDDAGRFAFDTLGDVNYSLFVADTEARSDTKYRADGSTNVVLPVKLYEWSRLKPIPPQ